MSQQEESVAEEPVSSTDDTAVEEDQPDEELTLEEVLEERDNLLERVEELEDANEELESKLARKAADFENYKKRQATQSAKRAEETTNTVVGRFLPVRDNLLRALAEESDDVEQLREGISLVLAEFERVLESLDVDEIAPEPGDTPDPNKHEVMMRMADDEEEGTIASVYQPGYERDGTIIRPAQVTVSDGPDENVEDNDDNE